MLATILIVINHDFLRQALRRWLELKFPQCPILEASGGKSALTLTRNSLPHLIITTAGLYPANELIAAGQLMAAAPEAWMVVLTTCEDTAYQVRTGLIGASICIPMQALPPLELQTTLALLLSYPRQPVVHTPRWGVISG